MITLFKHTLLLCLCLGFSIQAFSQEEGEFKKIVKEYKFDAQGNVEFHYYKELKLNSLLAINRLYGETFVIYNPHYQKLKVNSSYTLLPDGGIVKTPENAFNEVLPSFAANAPAYNHLKEMVITHTALEPGATIFLDYSIFSSHSSYQIPDIDDFLEEEVPVREYVYIIEIPQNQSLYYNILNLPEKPEVTEERGVKRYTWTFKNIPAQSHDPFQSSYQTDAPRITATGYSSTLKAIDSLYQNFHSPVNQQMADFTRQLTQNDKTLLDKVFTVQQYIISHVATAPIPGKYTGKNMRSPETVFQSAYGTLPEKVNLFMHMLNSLQIPSSLAVIYPGHLAQANLGLNSISQLLVYVQADNIPLFLAVTEQEILSPELRDSRDRIYIASDKGCRPLTVLSHPGKVNYEAVIQIDQQEANLQGNIQLIGGLIPVDKKDKFEARIKKAIQLEGDSVHLKFISLRPYHLQVNGFSSQSLSSQDGYTFYTLPEYGKGVHSWSLSPLYSKRDKSLEIPYSTEENYEYTILLSPGQHLQNPFTPIEKKYPIGSVSIQMNQEKGKINIRKKLLLNYSIIPAWQYDNFRKLMNIWNNKKYNTLIIK